MKKIAMFTMGTRGDVQPYIILSRALMNSGFDVILGSHPCWRSLIESYGVHFEPVGPDIDIEAEDVVLSIISNKLLLQSPSFNLIPSLILKSIKMKKIKE